jgi:hypothetical protein
LPNAEKPKTNRQNNFSAKCLGNLTNQTQNKKSESLIPHRLKNPTDEKLYRWDSLISGLFKAARRAFVSTCLKTGVDNYSALLNFQIRRKTMLKQLCPIMAGFFLASPYYVVAQQLNPLAFIKTTGSVLAVQAVDTLLYFSENQDGSFAFWSADVTKAAEPALLDSFSTAGLNIDFDIHAGYAYLAVADAAYGLRILNIHKNSF